VPRPLPPSPPLSIDAELREWLDHALLALGRLDSLTTLLPSTELFLYMYVRKEAVLSSQIEGTQSSLSDLLLFEIEEAPGVPLDDVTEVSNYVTALEHGLKRLRGGLPLSNRLIKETHGALLVRGRGADRQPGAFRRTQNWLGSAADPGDAVFVPPPPDRVESSMAGLERWLHNEPERTPVLIKAALAHAQFETIHPFLDGNGRVGRLLVTLLLCAEGVLREPLLYLSLYLKRNRATYYDLLQRTRSQGDWETWLAFFVQGVRETAEGAVATAKRLVDLFDRDRERIQELGRAAGSSLRVHAALQRRPLAGIGALARLTKLSEPTVATALKALARLHMVREITGRRRARIFSYDAYMKVLSEGTEPL
jgi:Fic family protein